MKKEVKLRNKLNNSSMFMGEEAANFLCERYPNEFEIDTNFSRYKMELNLIDRTALLLGTPVNDTRDRELTIKSMKGLRDRMRMIGVSSMNMAALLSISAQPFYKSVLYQQQKREDEAAYNLARWKAMCSPTIAKPVDYLMVVPPPSWTKKYIQELVDKVLNKTKHTIK